MSHADQTVIAIDGPAASGKSTVSRQVAESLGYVYVDSGSFYRGATWLVISRNIPPTDAAAVYRVIEDADWQLYCVEGKVVFEIDGEQPGDQIRSEPVVESVSDVAAVPEVRRFIVDLLRQTVRFGPLVMEGRDIGSVVFPDALKKYYLDANAAERARRRHLETHPDASESTLKKVQDSLRRRDQKDSSRASAPLQIPLGSQVINSTNMSIDEVVDLIISEVNSSMETA